MSFRLLFAAAVKAAEQHVVYAAAAASLGGLTRVDSNSPPPIGSEDFSFMTEESREPGLTPDAAE
jgi:hypothetical protein